MISAVFAFFVQFQDVIPYKKAFKEASHFIELGVVFVAITLFLGLLIAWIASIGLTLLKYANFTLRKGEEDLIIQKGLLEKQQLTIPLDRIQGITIVENPFRQLLGYCSVHLESAGGTAGEKGGASVIVMPMVKKEKALNMLTELFPDYCFVIELKPAPKRAAGRYMVRSCLYAAIPIAAAVWIFWPFGLGALTAFLPVALYGYACYKAAGWNIQGGQLAIRSRILSLQTVFMQKSRIQSLELIQTWRQNQKDLASIHSVIRSGITGKKTKMSDASAADAEKIYLWYGIRKEEQVNK
ncbi:PH domain-containing protein [Bacillus aerolatus]|uniref:PH domain-containing protein n=1 Tax=Bacillus aerolatus TaxID=2653354 RepID=A0A6I1FH08_9BACI|nr:PH domain-containing protein [Bacillus aerolatus]KAB7704802.1 PH domain-containing protein [Bacillus aerolatus]